MATSYNNLPVLPPPPANNNSKVTNWIISQGFTPRTITVDPITGKLLQIIVEENLTAGQISALQTKYPELSGGTFSTVP